VFHKNNKDLFSKQYLIKLVMYLICLVVVYKKTCFVKLIYSNTVDDVNLLLSHIDDFIKYNYIQNPTYIDIALNNIKLASYNVFNKLQYKIDNSYELIYMHTYEKLRLIHKLQNL
jgi:hypothetical protein